MNCLNESPGWGEKVVVIGGLREGAKIVNVDLEERKEVFTFLVRLQRGECHQEP